MTDLDRRQIAALDAYLTASDDPPARCKRRATKRDKEGDESRAEWEEWVARNLASREPSDLEREADVALAEEVLGE